MSEDYRWVEIHRRMDRVERAAEQVPVIAVTVQQIEKDVAEAIEEARSLKRALYTTALSVLSGAVIFSLTVIDVFK